MQQNMVKQNPPTGLIKHFCPTWHIYEILYAAAPWSQQPETASHLHSTSKVKPQKSGFAIKQ